ncbi:MAG: M48 family metallopeptidase [Spirochaetaceae bacterium]|nr:M48 family metallopeptidase [Spirochaetaceae bacterium]MBR3814601.1 M48 family metallopeptidase [Spirochaetaceae bacterium]MDD6486814.1 M48 family metallopeptidase [Spirochaetales bacterium]
MSKKIFYRLTLILFPLFFLVSCMTTTTAAGNVGADRKQVMLVSEEEMNESANQAYAEVLAEAKKAGTLNTNQATLQRVQKIAKRLIAQTPVFREDALGWDWQVNVIKEDTINAWCMPGGKIVVYTGIIDSLNLTDGELAAVMGHEISHALKEHSRERASQSALQNLGVAATAALLGLKETGTQLLGIAAEYTLGLPFSRKHETEADHVGTELMARAGYDPYEAVNIWKKMEAVSGSSVPEILSTHPSHQSRINDLQVIAEKVYPLYQEAQKKGIAK